MGTCYSGLGSKSIAANQTPIDPKVKTIVGQNDTENQNKVQTNKEFDNHCNHLSSSFENISFEIINDKKSNKSSMSSQQNRNKIPIPSSKMMSNNRVVPKRSEEFVLNKYKTKRYEASVDVNKVMIFDNSSTTSISSDCSLNLSKSSLKSTSSSASISGRQQTSIPKPSVKSRTPTPPIPNKYSANIKKSNKLPQNNSSIITDRLNGNDGNKTEIKSKNKSISFTESNSSKVNTNREPSYGTSIKYMTQVSGLPRPQTAHIVSTSSHSTDITNNHKINASNDIESRLKQYSENNSQNSRCDPNLRQIKPYYYGMGAQNKPYERPAERTNNTFNNKIQFQSQNTNPSKLQFNPMLSQNLNKKLRSVPTSAPNKSNPLDFGPKYRNVYREDTSIKNSILNNKNQNHYNYNEVKTETNDNLSQKSIENTFLPKSIQRVRELGPHFLPKDPKLFQNQNKTINKIEKPVESSPEHNSISSVGANSESDNRDFLIDDEICDQPELVLNSNIESKDLMKNLNNELEGLLLKQESSISPPTPPSPNISLSTASSTATLVPNTTFRKPRPLSLVEMADGSYGLDSPSFRAASQDLIGIKTLLFRLHGLLQNAETMNPFDSNYTQNKFYNQLSIAENDGIDPKESTDLKTENLDLKRQIVLQQQIIEDKDRTIRLLQQQMAKYSNINSAYIPQTLSSEKVNASSQTDRCSSASDINPRAVSDGSNGMLVSICCSHQLSDENQCRDSNPRT